MEAATGLSPEGAERVHRRPFVFVVDALVAALKREQLLLVESGEAGALDAAQVAAGAFDPEHLDGLAGEGVDLGDLGAGVAAGEVGDAQVGAEQVGAIAQQFRLVEGSSDRGIPAILKKCQYRGRQCSLVHNHQFIGNGPDVTTLPRTCKHRKERTDGFWPVFG